LTLPIWARALSATLLVQTMSSFAAAALPLLGPVLTQRWGMTPESIGYVSAALSVGICWYLACGGPMLRHLGPVRSLQLGLVFVAIGLLLLALPFQLAGLAGALMLGLGLGPNTPAGSQVLMLTAPARHRSLIFSIKQAGVPLGGAIAGLLVAHLVLGFGLIGAILTMAAAMVVCALVVQPFKRQLDADRTLDRRWPRMFVSLSGFAWSMRILGRYRHLPMLTAIGVSLSTMQACVTAFTATYLVTRHGKTLAEAGLLMAALLATSTFARVAFGWLADRMGRGMVLLSLLAIITSAAIIAMVMLNLEQSWLAYGCMIVVGATSLGWNGVHMAELARIAPPEHIGEVTSAASLCGFIGAVGGPVVFAAAVSAIGSFEWAFVLFAAPLALFGAFTLWRESLLPQG
jgi:MFS family permease